MYISSFSLCYKYGFAGFLIWACDLVIRLIKMILNNRGNNHTALVERLGVGVVRLTFSR